MKYALFAAMTLDVGCLLCLLIVAVREPRRINGRVRLLLPIPLCYLAAAIFGYEVFRRSDPGPLSFFLLLWLVYCGAVTLITAQRCRRAQNAAQKQTQIERHYAQEEEYYEQLIEKQEQTRALWHDMEKYLRAAEAEGTDAAEQARLTLKKASDVPDVGNRALNVILNEYRARTSASGIRFEWQVQVPSKLSVSVVDLYILLGNTIDNAIEACMALPTEDRTIRLSLQQTHDVLFYRLSNPYAERTEGQKPGIHGYGLRNVRACVKKYGGATEITRENGWFCFSAHMNAPVPNECSDR
ncbi:MAG: sensor histidine kinase [Clostridia bacterium]|nr:sensor histidine kinase [Clostridia bacterium]